MINWRLSKRQVLEVTKHSRKGTSVQIIVLSPADSSYGIFRHVLPTNHTNVRPFDSVIEFEGNTVNRILEALVRLKDKIQLDATYNFITLMLGSKCFGHHYAHRQELSTIAWVLPHRPSGYRVAAGWKLKCR